MSKKTMQKAETRDRILASAVERLRLHGISGASVQEVMRGAGLTVGGFYAHFPSKQTLVREALRASAAKTRALLLEGGERSPGAVLEGAVRRYLSAGHRDHPEAGCALPATITEAAQADEAVRDEVTRELDELAGELEAKAGLSRARALSTLALFVGGIILSRAVPGTRLSDELLEACREAALAAPPE